MKNLPRPNEELFVTRLKAKERDAWTDLYSRYAGSLNTIVLQVMGKNNHECQDILQVVFLKLWRNIGSYDPEKGRLFTWMMPIARNTAIDAKRRADKRQKGLKKAVTETYQECDSPKDKIGDLLPMQSKWQQIYNLYYIQGLTQQQAAERMNIPLSTFKSQLRTAKLHINKSNKSS